MAVLACNVKHKCILSSAIISYYSTGREHSWVKICSISTVCFWTMFFFISLWVQGVCAGHFSELLSLFHTFFSDSYIPESCPVLPFEWCFSRLTGGTFSPPPGRFYSLSSIFLLSPYFEASLSRLRSWQYFDCNFFCGRRDEYCILLLLEEAVDAHSCITVWSFKPQWKPGLCVPFNDHIWASKSDDWHQR